MCENGLQGNLLKQLTLCISTWGRSSAVLRSSHCFDPVSPGHSIVITTTHWIASSSPGLLLTIASWVLFRQLVIGSAFSAALRCFPTMHIVGAQCGTYWLCWMPCPVCHMEHCYVVCVAVGLFKHLSWCVFNV